MTDIVSTCGDYVCQSTETVMNCPLDCKASLADYYNCVMDKSICFTPGLHDMLTTLLLFIVGIILIYYLKKKGII